MDDEDEAKIAISDLNGYEMDGMNLKVEVRLKTRCFLQ